MNVRKAVITAAARSQRQLPLQVLTDTDGVTRSVLEMLVREAISAGVEQVGVVIAPGDHDAYASALGSTRDQVVFVEQPEPRGYGDAIRVAASFVGEEPFLHIVGDHLFLSKTGQSCAKALVAVAQREECTVSAVQPTREHMLPYYGTIGGRLVSGQQGLYEVEHVVEKPTPTEAEQSLIVPGMRAGHYLCFVGMHVLTSGVIQALHAIFASGGTGTPPTLSDALARLTHQERYLALELKAARYNVGVKHGLLMAQLAIALSGPDRDEVLTGIIELLARAQRDLSEVGGAMELTGRLNCVMTTPDANSAKQQLPMSRLLNILTSTDRDTRDTPIESALRGLSIDQLLTEARTLDSFRRTTTNLYDRVRALFFLHAIHRFHLPADPAFPTTGSMPYIGYQHLLARRFDEAIDTFLHFVGLQGASDPLSSCLAAAYKELAFQTLANQVRRSVRSVRGNQWMFRIGHPADHPLRIRPELLRPDADGIFPTLVEKTPVRMDLTHSGWSDIFFLGMDFPEGARVLNVSIDLAVHGRDPHPRPPVEAYVRVIDEPVLRLVSVDLGARADITELAEVFDFARDYLGLLKAAFIAAGCLPPGTEGSGASLAAVLARLVGPGLGLELVSSVNNIPKGSRLAVSTNLLGSLISVLMRATRQAKSLSGPLQEAERRVVAARAILGEWIGGSGGGWQDSGGVWPGMKVISGSIASEGDPEFGVSRGRLLPTHCVLDRSDASDGTRRKLQESLVLVHGGMAQNVGPILEMVTEKYLLRSEREWAGRKQAIGIFDEILDCLRRGDIQAIAAATTRNFTQPIQTIIPWASNRYTEILIDSTRKHFGEDFWGFWMLGGMSGGGMGFIVAPHRKAEAQAFLQKLMSDTKRSLQSALPFAMEPVVYDFAINERGTFAAILEGEDNLLPAAYYAFMGPAWTRTDPRLLTAQRRAELNRFASACRTRPELSGTVETLFDRLFPQQTRTDPQSKTLHGLLGELGFDRAQHEQIRADLQSGRIGLPQNRLPASTTIENVKPDDVIDARGDDHSAREIGLRSLRAGEVAVLSLAAGAGSRWTQGAGVVKALHPFCRLGGQHRSFLDVHLAKSRCIGRRAGMAPAHLIATSYLTHDAIARAIASAKYDGPLMLSPGRAIGLRMVPTVRDLRFAWEETAHMALDEQKQRMRESLQAALISWARSSGEASDYTDNLPQQCLHPVGHFFELPNLLRNGMLVELLKLRPALRHLMLHNIDTVGADADPTMLGRHIDRGACLSFEVITRRLEDRGGGLARVNGRCRLVEGLAMPREDQEFSLSYYNSMTTWIDLDQFLQVMDLSRNDLRDEPKVSSAIRSLAARVPTYITLKDVKKRWGYGQEDVLPVTQFEKLWSDLSSLPEIDTAYFVVPRTRGQQLKEQAQLDGWLRDGSAAHVESLCDFE